ncbi:tail completion protein gp17 [Lysobacter antibioticus]|uniref:tail completion protein gp17 n=1 Tax=Lysobacter antibioticus TaxID=84531 RepID=UPI0007E8BE2D|nr:DUF3168 domain-containing protein [Lysobacter antibioticus]
MFPPVYKTIRTPEVIAIVADRIGRHGEIGQDEQRPYITWSIVIGNPHDQISGAPCSDFTSVDINCWHPTDGGVEQLALEVRAALDAAGHHNRVRVNLRDPETRLYRVGIEADFITQR